jgi:hypothetical protein
VGSAEQEVKGRRARRVLWAFRIVFYGGAFLAAPALLGLGGEAESPSFVDGSTSQGQALTMRFEDGRPIGIGTHVSATCRPPLEWGARWWTTDGRSARFRFADGRLTVRQKVEHDYRDGWIGDRSFTLEARVDGERVRGAVRYVETIRYGAYPPYVCESGDVTFFAGD